ncbi:calcium/sodium antiporter [Nitrospinota bacterium]
MKCLDFRLCRKIVEVCRRCTPFGVRGGWCSLGRAWPRSGKIALPGSRVDESVTLRPTAGGLTREPDRVESFFQSLPVWLNVVIFAAGVAAIFKGAGWFTDGAVGIADATGVPKILIGATIVSIATTLPEVGVSYIAALLGRPATSVGNAVGSTICNIGFILAVVSVIQPMGVPRSTARVQGLAMLAAGAFLVLLSWDGGLGRWDGGLLLTGTAVYLWIMARQSGWNNGNSVPGGHSHDWSTILRHFVIGAVCVVGGSVLVVQSAAMLARAAGVPELVIALTLVALGTSLPECVTAASSLLRGHGEIAVGNVIGANVLNVTLVLGGSAAILPLNIERQTFVLDFPAMAALMLLAYLFGTPT